MTAILALFSPIIVMVLFWLLKKRQDRISKELKLNEISINKPDFEDEISTQEGVTYSKKSSVDDRLIEIDKHWKNPMF